MSDYLMFLEFAFYFDFSQSTFSNNETNERGFLCVGTLCLVNSRVRYTVKIYTNISFVINLQLCPPKLGVLEALHLRFQ